MRKWKAFIIAFWLCLALPSLLFPLIRNHIDSANHEKRKYADFPVLSPAAAVDFPEGFENYYNDRIPFKNQLKALNTKIDSIINRHKSLVEYASGAEQGAVRGQDNWLFFFVRTEKEDSTGDYLGLNYYTEDQLWQLADYYQQLYEYFQKKGIELIVFVPPSKEQIYPEYMPTNLKPADGQTRTEQAIDFLRKHTPVNFVYPRDALLAEKQYGQLYFKYDSHWNSLGSFVGTQALMELLKGKGLSLADVKPIKKSPFRKGDLAGLLGTGAECTDESVYGIENYYDGITAEREVIKKGQYHYTSNAEDKRNVLLLGDSYIEYMTDQLPKEFADVELVRDEFPEYALEMINQGVPDVVILEIQERRKLAFENFGYEIGWLDEKK